MSRATGATRTGSITTVSRWVPPGPPRRIAVELALLTLAALLLWALPSWAQEARCSQLGSVCACSEPLNNLDPINTNSHNPSDSTAKECSANGVSLGFGTGTDLSKVKGVPGSSVGLPNLTGVLEVTRAVVAPSQLGDRVVRDFTDGTYCSRYYVRFDANTWTDQIMDRVNESNHNDMKDGRWVGPQDPGNCPQLQCIWERERSSCGHAGIGPFGTKDPAEKNRFHGSWVSGFGMEDCLDAWCRVETCFDHNSRSGADADKLVYRRRAYRVSDGATWTWTPVLSIGSNPTVDAGSGQSQFTKLTAFDTPDWSDSPTTEGTVSWYSHGMVAILPTADENFWIGAAQEIEGNASPGAGTAPDPPILLP